MKPADNPSGCLQVILPLVPSSAELVESMQTMHAWSVHCV